MSVISARSVSKTFKVPSVRRETVREHVFGLLKPRRVTTLVVLDEVSFEIERGETLGIMGRNGSGKSTLLKVLCGIYPPDSGRVEVGAAITPILELGVGWNPELDAIDNIYLIACVMGLSLKAIRQRLDEILSFAELERFARLQLKFYSSGMAARLAYAVAFSAAREVLVLDEIFAVGDAGFKAKCEEKYRLLKAAGHTVVLVSHDPRIIRTFCDRAMLLEGGQIVLEAPSAVVADRYQLMLTSAHAPAQPV